MRCMQAPGHMRGAAARSAPITLAVMIRTSLRHTGHALVAGPATQAILFAAAVSGVLRILAALSLPGSREILFASGLLWTAAFFGFAAVYGPMLFKRRIA